MVNYLCRYGMLRASVRCIGCRGARRQFSFADLVFARAVGKLLKAGASVTALRRALSTLRRLLAGQPSSAILGKHVVIVGQSVYLPQSDRELIDLTANGQLAFHFVLDGPISVAGKPVGKPRQLSSKRA